MHSDLMPSKRRPPTGTVTSTRFVSNVFIITEAGMTVVFQLAGDSAPVVGVMFNFSNTA